MTHYAIIGTGVAAIGAAETIRSVDGAGEISFFGEDPFSYYSRPGLAYYLTGELDENLLFPYQKEDYQKLRAHFHRASIMRILPDEKKVELDTSARLPYDRLLIATGAQAIALKIPGAGLIGVHKLDHLSDARALLANAKRGRTALVTGGGITALELAEGLATRGGKVHYVMRSERYWPNVLDEIESRLIESLLAREGIHLYHKNEVIEILGKNGKVVGARLADGRSLRADLFAYAIGIAPRIDLAQEAGIACERGILVDQSMQTNLPDIFSAGDVAQVYDPVSGKHVLDSLWAPAREQGRIAGLNMAGQPAAYQKPAAFNVTRLAGLTTTIIGAVGGGRDDDLEGIARGDSETWRQLPDAIVAQGGFEVNRLRLMVGQKNILGAIVMGDQKLSSPLQTIVRQKVDITSIRRALLVPHAPIADILAEFWGKNHALQSLQALGKN
ncbi:MAG: FAD-dependent oxidoreductase [Anaerolineae bacterium]|nr:FAD-dependent oxidoreductase [Anaerolineae bacterium]